MEESVQVDGATVIDIEGAVVDDEEVDFVWVSSISKRSVAKPKNLKASAITNLGSIHRVPHDVRQANPTAYQPQVISIGPLHYQKRSRRLQTMEKHKWRYLHDLLTRSSTNEPEHTVKTFLKLVKTLEKQARLCYSEEFDNISSKDFVEMLLLDGCFLVEYFYKIWTIGNKDIQVLQQANILSDPLIWSPLQQTIQLDLIMLENQIPFFVLQALFKSMRINVDCTLQGLVLYFFGKETNSSSVTSFNTTHPVEHILHLLHSYDSDGNSGASVTRKGPLVIQSASKLKEAGIKFKKGNANLWTVKFDSGVLEIPPWTLTNNECTRWANIIAFEHSYHRCSNHFSAFLFFMDCLVNTSKDVEILSEKGIIVNVLGSNGEAAAFFNNVTKHVSLCTKAHYLTDLFADVNDYCKRSWPKFRTTLMNDYFNSPWAIISFFAAVLLLLLTLTQTFFSTFPKFAFGD